MTDPSNETEGRYYTRSAKKAKDSQIVPTESTSRDNASTSQQRESDQGHSSTDQVGETTNFPPPEFFDETPAEIEEHDLSTETFVDDIQGYSGLNQQGDKRELFESGGTCNFTRVIKMEYMVYTNFFGFVLPPLVAMFAIYGYIYTVVRRQMQKICALHRASAAAAAAAASGGASTAASSQPPKTVPKTVDGGGGGGGCRRSASAGEFRVHENGFQRTESTSSHAVAVAVTSSKRHSTDDCRTTIGESDDNRNSKEVKEIEERQLTFVAEDDGSGQQSNNLTEEVELRRRNSRLHESEKQRRRELRSSERESCSFVFGDRTMTRKSAFTWKKEIRAAKWFAVVLTVFTLCWLPLHVLNCITVFSGSTSCSDCVTFAALLSHVNSAVNPVLYAYSNSKFFAVFRRMLRLKVTQSSFRDRSSFLPTPTPAPKMRPKF